MKSITTLIISSLLVLSLCSCPSPVNDNRPDIPDPDSPNIVENEDLFVSNGSTRMFSTNYYEFGAGNGATYWIQEEHAVSAFYDFSVSMKKISGHSLGAFGVYFAQRSDGSVDFSSLVVFINSVGEFCVGLIDNGSFTYLREWTDCDFLIRGYNQSNSVSVKGSGTGEYRIILNGNEVLSFEDPSEPAHVGGGFGYLAVVSPLENFPSIPVSVLFENLN